MTARERRGVRFAMALMFVPALVGLATAGRAQADPNTDYAYLRTLDHFGVDYSTPTAAVAMGHAVCDTFDAGFGFYAVVASVVRGGWDPGDAASIVGASIGAYCPWHEDELEGNRGVPA